MNARHEDGHSLALLACGLLVFDAFLVAATAGFVQYSTRFGGYSLTYLIGSTPLPFVLYAIWGLGVAGAVTAMITAIFYNYRHRWFWRTLVVAAALFLFFSPIHMVIGIISLILLFRFRREFSDDTTMPANIRGV